MSVTPSDFVHLHVHTMYSLLDGAIRLDALFERAKDYGMHSVAITDHGTMFNVLEFFQKAHAADIKPIIGCECYVAPRTMADKSPLDAKGLSHLVLLAENQEGYRNLCRLATVAQSAMLESDESRVASLLNQPQAPQKTSATAEMSR